MSFAHRVLTILVALPLLGSLASAQASEDEPIVAPHQEEVVIEIDGTLDESAWNMAAHRQLVLDGTEDEDDQRFAQFYVTHNMTHLFIAIAAPTGHTLDLQFHGTAGGMIGGMNADGIHVDTEGHMHDLHWDGDERSWRADTEVEGCGDIGEAAMTEQGDLVIFEISRPLEGDPCNTQLRLDEDIRFRVALYDEVTEDSYRWPEGSIGSIVGHVPHEMHFVTLHQQIQTWGVLRLEAPAGTEAVPGAPTPSPPLRDDSGWHTGERHTMDPDQPIHGLPVHEQDPTYDHTGIPAPGFAYLAFLALGLLGVVYLVRREAQ